MVQPDDDRPVSVRESADTSDADMGGPGGAGPPGSSTGSFQAAPQPAIESDSGFEWTVRICGAIGAAVGVVVLACWLAGYGDRLSLGGRFKPMSPVSALLFAISGGAMLIGRSRSAVHGVRRSVAVLAVLAIMVAGASIVDLLADHALCIDRQMFHTDEQHETAIEAHISPVTACGFLTVGTAILLSTLRVRRPVAMLGTGLVVMAWVELTSYWFGVPLLHGLGSKAMALATAAVFLILGVGLVACAGPRAWPLSVFTCVVPPPGTPPPRWFARGSMGLLLLFVVMVAAAGHAYIEREYAESRQAARDRLSAVADLKVGQITNWYRERMGDASYFLDGEHVADVAKAFLDSPSAPATKAQMYGLMAAVRTHFRYNRVQLVGVDGQVRLACPAEENWIGARATAFIAETCRTGQIQVSDLHPTQIHPNAVNMDVFVPLLHRTESRSGPPRVIAVLMLEIDPSEFLFPTIRRWPTPSASGEALLVRREGDEVVFLNELRHSTDIPLTLRLSIDKHPKLPAAKVVAGTEGIVEGVDYRGMAVLAALRKVPDTPWFLVAKVDQTEIYAPMRERVWITSVILLMLVLLFGLGGVLLQRRRNQHWLVQQLNAERRLLALEKRFRLLFEGARDAIIWADANTGILLHCNSAAEALLSRDRTEIVGKHQTFLHPPEQLEFYREHFRSHVAMDPHRNLNAEIVRKDGRRVAVEIFPSVIDLGEQRIIQGIFRDVTERKRVEEELARYRNHLEELVAERTRELDKSREQLQQAQRLASIGTLAAGIAHEINNPLGMMLLSMDLAMDSLGRPEALAELLRQQKQDLERCARIVKGVLDFARQGAKEKSPLDLNEAVRHGLDLTREYARRHGVAVETRLAGGLSSISGNATDLEQVVVNLVQNAVHACGRRGCVTVETCGVNGGVRLVVRDNGCGMAPDEVRRAFDPFFTTRIEKGGTGLGLITVHGIVTQHGGTIEITSEPGKGTVVTIDFPACTETEAAHGEGIGR